MMASPYQTISFTFRSDSDSEPLSAYFELFYGFLPEPDSEKQEGNLAANFVI